MSGLAELKRNIQTNVNILRYVKQYALVRMTREDCENVENIDNKSFRFVRRFQQRSIR